MTIVEETRAVTGGVDTHADVHVAAALDELGALLGTAEFATTPDGYAALLAWLDGFGPVTKIGIEGTGSYGAGLARTATAHGTTVVEVDCPNRQDRFRHGKSDTVDAVSAARAALSGHAAGLPKGGTGPVEAMRVILVAKRSARAERVRTLNQMRHLVFAAPDDIRARFYGLNVYNLTRQAAAMRPRPADGVDYVTLYTLRELGRRVRLLEAEIDRFDELLQPIVAAHAPALLNVFGCGLFITATLCVAAGDQPGRIRNEAAWANLCGVAPIPAGSGKTNGRVRLNRGGNRQANSALYGIVLVRMGHHEPTKIYVERRRAEGRNTLEIMRCLKRYVARETFKHLPRGAD
ncbi:MAG: IS110 family transposase [Acidobacteria bacterium]|nr:IS110 family transposase [Acidobacteriota bacterium]